VIDFLDQSPMSGSVSPSRHRFLTIHHLTRGVSALSNPPVMTAITVKRSIVRRTRGQTSARRRSFRELARCYFASESNLEFAIEALFFAIIVAILAWPVITAVGALQELLQNAPG
jgi:hypothetical protein